MTKTAAYTIAAVLSVAAIAAIAVGLGGPGKAPALFAGDRDAGAHEHHLHGGTAGDHHTAQIGMQRMAFPEAKGSVPSAEAAESLEQVSGIDIDGDSDFRPSNGIRGGNGTLDDPFVISGYHVTGELSIRDTDACVVVTGNYIDGQLALNWNGPCLHVHHNYIRDLRVNENNARTGYATGGLLEMNKIQVVGQLRHYDGEFRENVVGPFEASDLFDTVLETTPLLAPEVLVANIDGFNQGLIHHNTFYGSVDLDLHGHHHGTGFFAPHSHYHGDNETRMDLHEHDHTDRWTSVAFTDNVVIDNEGYGLRYEDENHAGDDQTANSESEETLEDPHQHHTMVDILRNTIEGQLVVDIFNADDELHETRNPGWLTLEGNKVTFAERDESGPLGLPLFVNGQIDFGPAAMVILATKEVDLVVRGNDLTYVPLPEQGNDPATDPLGALGLPDFFDPYGDVPSAGILVRDMRDANLTIEGNHIRGATYGVYASEMDRQVDWQVESNTFEDANTEVYYDESVANHPHGNNAP